MRCPECGAAETKVIDSRVSGDAVRRRRVCEACSARFTTHERIEQRQLWVLKSSGQKEPFQREKVLHGIHLACRKRPCAGEVESLVNRVIARLEDRREAAIPSQAVGEAVMQVLREVDEVAYVRFASVYQAFESVDQFIEAVLPLRHTP